MHVIYSLTRVKIVYCNFALGCVTLKICIFWKTVLFEKLRYFERLRYLKIVLLWKTGFENCDTWKTALLWKFALLVKLRYFENCNTWKTVILEKLCYLKNWLVFWITMLLEKILRWGALLVKYCVGVRYFKILLYCKNVALFEKWSSF